MILDQVVLYRIKNSENSRAHNSKLKSIISSNLEDDNSLDWIDHWAELEDIVEKDIVEKGNTHVETIEKSKEE